MVAAREETPLGSFSDIVASIYDCVLDPNEWPATLDQIRATSGGAAAWIAVHYPDQVRSVYQIEVGTDPDRQRLLREHYVAASPFIGITHHVQLGDIVSVADVIDYDEFVAGRFYKEWSAPQGWVDFILAVVAKQEDRFSWLGICLQRRATEEQKRIVAAFRPHIERALRISDLLELRTVEAADLAAAVEGLATGMILVDAAYNVRGINPAAEQMMRDTGTLCTAGGHLRAPMHGAGADLMESIAACADGRLDRAGASILFNTTDGGVGLLMHVLPLARPHSVPGREAIAALFLTNPVGPSRAPIDAFGKHYGLTPSETRVLLAIAEGKSPRAIAAAQGVGMPTVRTHLRRLYDKTGTNGQTGVIRLFAGLSNAP